MILAAQHIRERALKGMITPFCERTVHRGMTFGIGPNGYDIRLGGSVSIRPGRHALGVSVERFALPNDICSRILDKSTWIRRGVKVGNTIAEAGWCGYLTLEIFNHTDDVIDIAAGTPIAQMVFELLTAPTDQPYRGKYQDQPSEPVAAKMECSA
jgi:dCTP deaminase